MHDESMVHSSGDDDSDDDMSGNETDPNAKAMLNLFKRMEITSYSTAFSGIDSPGTSFAQLRASMCKKAGRVMHQPKHIHAVDA